MVDKRKYRVQTEEHELYGTLGCCSFGLRLEYVREEYGLTKAAVARAVGVAPSTWGTYEHDLSFPDMKTIVKFCDLFNVNIEWLFTNEGNIYTDEGNINEEKGSSLFD